MRLLTHLPTWFLLGALLPAMAHAQSQNALTWNTYQEPEACHLEASLSEKSSVSFVATAGQKPVMELKIPFRNRVTKEAELLEISPPWREKGQSLVSHSRQTGSTQLNFENNIQSLLDGLGNGQWAQVSLASDEGDLWRREISSVGISEYMQSFNDCRNSLPPLRFTDINDRVVLFPHNSTDISPEGRRMLNLMVEYLTYDDSIQTIQIDGHTDRTGQRLINLTISRQRAEKVRDHLLDAGVSPELISIIRWHGDRYPLNADRTREQQQQNRRVEIKLLRTPPPQTSANPSIDWS